MRIIGAMLVIAGVCALGVSLDMDTRAPGAVQGDPTRVELTQQKETFVIVSAMIAVCGLMALGGEAGSGRRARRDRGARRSADARRAGPEPKGGVPGRGIPPSLAAPRCSPAGARSVAAGDPVPAHYAGDLAPRLELVRHLEREGLITPVEAERRRAQLLRCS